MGFYYEKDFIINITIPLYFQTMQKLLHLQTEALKME